MRSPSTSSANASFAGPDPRIEERLPLIEEAAHITARGVTEVVHRHHEKSRRLPYIIKPAARTVFRNFCASYFADVDAFKATHDFSLGALINDPKKAALTAIVAMKLRKLLFAFHSQVREQAEFSSFAITMFIAEAAKMYLKADEKVFTPPRLYDLGVCINYMCAIDTKECYRAGSYMMCLYMDALWPTRSRIEAKARSNPD